MLVPTETELNILAVLTSVIVNFCSFHAELKTEQCDQLFTQKGDKMQDVKDIQVQSLVAPHNKGKSGQWKHLVVEERMYEGTDNGK